MSKMLWSNKYLYFCSFNSLLECNLSGQIKLAINEDFMKILVPVKRVIDYNVKIRVKADQSDVELNNVKMALNPFCEIAVEEAVRLKEAGIATEVIVVSIGSNLVQEQIRTALALGADRGIHINTDQKLDSIHVARLLKKVIETEQPSLTILGKQSIDADNNQTAQMLAAMTNYSQGTFASKVTVEADKVLVTREIDAGLQTIALTLPAIISTDLRLNEPRYASLPNIMKAKRKPIDTVEASSFEVDLSPSFELISVSAPAQRTGGVKLASVAELVEKLKNEAKVI